ncbi:CHAT domain-containing protein [Streptomyces phaeolivaceus]|uniref:CHAT domain-containing protein n=1 Tax=Streptomyces phaeolivaceus TaxID=2653200 RepID=A0A5P8KDX5_9ACTN|nr:CHAT domain-containing protein [Streptomyces phaeolivaceus]QFR00989.1 CHAT domain-containing protein [Streptomyces phaeolivaceus]
MGAGLVRALRAAAVAMDAEWQPGTSTVPFRSETAAAPLATGGGTRAAAESVADRRLRLAAHLAGRHWPVLLSARMTIGHGVEATAAQERAVRHGVDAHWTERDRAEAVREPLKWFDALYGEYGEYGACGVYGVLGGADALACDALAQHLLLAADLRVRAGDRAGAGPSAREGVRCASGSPASAGFAALLVGDWRLGRPGAAEQCGVEPPGARALSRAAARYRRAEAAYRDAGSERGRAAVLLRLAHVERLGGRPEACERFLARAEESALAAGDGACTALIRVHREIDAIAVGARSGAGVAEAVAHWARTDGSTSWLRGLRQLVLERAEFWSARGDTVRAGRAAGLARGLGGEGGGAGVEAGLYRRARHRLVGVVLAGTEQQEHVAAVGACVGRGEAPGLADCLGVIAAAQAFHRQAVALRDPELMRASGESIEVAIEVGTRYLPGGDQVDTVLALLRSDLVSGRVHESYLRSRRARTAGLVAEADRLARRALREAEGVPDELFRLVVGCSARVDLGERAAAVAAAEAAEPSLTALAAAALWLRLGEPERAARYLPRIGVDGPGPEHPWELPAIRADLALARHAHDEAAAHAREGIRAFEEHRRRLARDALRASSADDPVVAGLHHAAVVSLLSSGRPDAVAAAFDQAERARAGFLDTVHALDTAPSGSPARTAVRDWLAAEVHWSAEFEERAATLRAAGQAGGERGRAGQDRVGEMDGKRWLGEVERGLGVAEEKVRRLAPAALGASYAGELPDAAAVAGALPGGTLLLTYHVFDDVLIGWAMTRDGLTHERQTRRPHTTVAAVRRFHAWCARPDAPGPGGDDEGEAAGRELAELLLRPFAGALDGHRRVIVVPPAAFALLPFHALPWEGDVLGDTHDVSYLPAVSLLTRRHGRPPDRPWTEVDALLVGAPASDPRHGLRELPGTAAEVVEGARLLPRGRALTGPAATRDAVLAAAHGCEVLHFATHGMVDELAPHRSRLPLAGDDVLGLADLLGVAHEPRLLVLSGCDTGRGTATAGGDVLGLTRAALITGARHAVVSLWPVDDTTGCLVLARTYAWLAEEPAVHPGTALARARREVRDLSGAERYEEFRALARRAGVHPGPADRGPAPAAPRPRSRDSAPLGTGRVTAHPRHPYHWAPFIHVGT